MRMGSRFVLVILALSLLFSSISADVSWRMWGNNNNNDRLASREYDIDRTNVDRLTLSWTYTANGDVPATPTVHKGRVYFTDLGGWIHCVWAKNGSLIWKASVASLTGITDMGSRTSPAISSDGKTLVIGARPNLNLIAPQAFAIALDARNGSMIWKTLLSDNPYAWITQSASLVKDRDGEWVYMGVSSNELFYGAIIGSFSFIGSICKLRLTDGALVWKTNTLPTGYTGASVWGGMPAYDALMRKVYIGTGNTYSVPAVIEECNVNRNNSIDPPNYPSCVVEGNNQDAIMSLDEDDGEVEWSHPVGGLDTWNFGCGLPEYGIPPIGTTCPQIAGPDYDFAQAPMLVWADIGERNDRDRKRKTLLAVAGQKSGYVYAMKAGPDCKDKGEIVWSRLMCPGGKLGGMQWGSATDGKRIYVACANSRHVPFRLHTRNETTVKGIWAALDLTNGTVLWETIDPSPYRLNTMLVGALTALPGDVVLGGTSADEGTMFALDARNGNILFSHHSQGAVVAGPSVVDGSIYWPSGYSVGEFRSNSKVLAFKLSNN